MVVTSRFWKKNRNCNSDRCEYGGNFESTNHSFWIPGKFASDEPRVSFSSSSENHLRWQGAFGRGMMIVLVVIVPVTTIVHLLLRLNRRNIKLIVMCLSMIVMMKTSILWQFLLSSLLWFTFISPRSWQNLTPVQITFKRCMSLLAQSISAAATDLALGIVQIRAENFIS